MLLFQGRDFVLVLFPELVRRVLQAKALELECLRSGFLGFAGELGERRQLVLFGELQILPRIRTRPAAWCGHEVREQLGRVRDEDEIDLAQEQLGDLLLLLRFQPVLELVLNFILNLFA